MANPEKALVKDAPRTSRAGQRPAKRFICNMDPELHQRLKEYAWARQVPMAQLVNEWVAQGLAAAADQDSA